MSTEPVQNPKPCHFMPFEFFDHTGSLSEFPTRPWWHLVLAVPSTLGPDRASFLPSSLADSPSE